MSLITSAKIPFFHVRSHTQRFWVWACLGPITGIGTDTACPWQREYPMLLWCFVKLLGHLKCSQYQAPRDRSHAHLFQVLVGTKTLWPTCFHQYFCWSRLLKCNQRLPEPFDWIPILSNSLSPLFGLSLGWLSGQDQNEKWQKDFLSVTFFS